MQSSSTSSVSVAAHLLFCAWSGLARTATLTHSSHWAKVVQGQFGGLLAVGTSFGRGPWRRTCSDAAAGTGASSGWCLRLAARVFGLVGTMVGISWGDWCEVLSALLNGSSEGCKELGSSGISRRSTGPNAARAWRAAASCSSSPLASAAYYLPYQSCHFEFTCPVSSRFHFFLFLINFCHFIQLMNLG